MRPSHDSDSAMDTSDTNARGRPMRAVVFHVRNRLSHATHSTDPLTVGKNQLTGVDIGREQCPLDPLVSQSHGTLECTPQHGVWVYVDHSERGTLLNHKQLVHRDAAIVRDGDVLSLGNTEITLAFPMQISSQPADNQAIHNNNATAQPLPSQLAKQLIPNINTDARPPSTVRAFHQVAVAPEHINSPIPGANWRKKRHSISHVSTRMPFSLGSASTSQSFDRSKPLVPSAPSTPPLKDAPSRPVSHHHHVAIQSPQSPYYHVKWKQDQEQPETTMEEGKNQHQEDEEPLEELPPPLEYSSSPMATTMFLDRLQHSPPANAKPSPPLHHPLGSPPAKPTPTRRTDLRIQVTKRNAGLASGGGGGGGGGPKLFSSGTPTASGGTNPRPVHLARGATSPSSAGLHSILKNINSPQRRIFGGDGLTPPASPVAQRDIKKQNDSLLEILQSKFKEEEKLKRQQEEWIRREYPATTTTTGTVPSMSPIRHDGISSTGNKVTGHEIQTAAEDEEEDLTVPPKAPALLRTVSLGYAPHQPSPRLTAALLASRAARRGHDALHATTAALPPHSLQHRDHLHRTSGDSSVASSVSTEPSNYRRVTRSLSFSSSQMASSGELNDFLGYDDDDACDDLLSFTSFFGADDPHKSSHVTTASRGSKVMSPMGGAVLLPSRPHRRSRLPSLDDEMAGVLNSPSRATRHSDPYSSTFGSAAASSSASSSHSHSVAKPHARSADLRNKPLFRRMRQLGMDMTG